MPAQCTLGGTGLENQWLQQIPKRSGSQWGRAPLNHTYSAEGHWTAVNQERLSPRFHWNGKQVWWLPFFLKSWTVECETFKQTHVLQRDDLFMTINWISFDPNVACHTTANSPLEQLFTNTFRKADSVFRVTSFKPNLVFHSFWLYFL